MALRQLIFTLLLTILCSTHAFLVGLKYYDLQLNSQEIVVVNFSPIDDVNTHCIHKTFNSQHVKLLCIRFGIHFSQCVLDCPVAAQNEGKYHLVYVQPNNHLTKHN